MQVDRNDETEMDFGDLYADKDEFEIGGDAFTMSASSTSEGAEVIHFMENPLRSSVYEGDLSAIVERDTEDETSSQISLRRKTAIPRKTLVSLNPVTSPIFETDMPAIVERSTFFEGDMSAIVERDTEDEIALPKKSEFDM